MAKRCILGWLSPDALRDIMLVNDFPANCVEVKMVEDGPADRRYTLWTDGSVTYTNRYNEQQYLLEPGTAGGDWAKVLIL